MFQILNNSFKCVEDLYRFSNLMIVNNIITTIIKFKEKVNTAIRFMEDYNMLIIDKLKESLYTKVKKTMTKKMYQLYYRENKEILQSQDEYEANLLKTYRHLDACRFKNKGWPCPTCPKCCFHGKDYETMMEVMDFAQQWMKENPDKARFMKTPKALHKH